MRATHRGFTLIEVLIAVAVLSVGLLGIAGMQIFSLQSNHDAYLRTQASILAYSLIEKMRANRDAAIAGDYNINIDDAPSGSSVCYGTSSNCDEDDLAEFDLNQWKCELGKFNSAAPCSGALNMRPAMPNGDGSVAVSGNDVTVTVQWQDSDRRINPTASSRSLEIVAKL